MEVNYINHTSGGVLMEELTLVVDLSGKENNNV